MVKKIIAVVTVAILIVATVVTEQIFVDNTLSGLMNKIQAIDVKISENEDINNVELQNLIDDLDTFWTEKEGLLCITINHNDLNRVGEQIKKIKVYIEQNNKDDCTYEVKVLAFYAESYKHVMELNFQNLF